MFIRWLFAALHLLALGIGLGAIWARSRALRGVLDPQGLKRVFAADNWWGLAAIVWIGTGVTRAFGGLEKGTQYYAHNVLFQAKMAMLVTIIVLEIAPVVAFIGWRRQVARGSTPDTHSARTYATTSTIQTGLIVLMVLAATAMARGYGQGH